VFQVLIDLSDVCVGAARVRAGLEALRRIDIQGVSRAVADMAES